MLCVFVYIYIYNFLISVFLINFLSGSRNWVLLGIWGLELKIFLWGFGISKAFGSFGWQTHLRLIKKCLIRSTDTWQQPEKTKQLGLRSSAEELGLEAQIGYFLGLDLGGASHT